MMPREYGDEREGYEEDHSDRDDYPEEVWEEMQLEKWQAEHRDDDHLAASEPEIDDDERLEKLAQDFDKLGREQGTRRVEPDTNEPF
jgi:hypothetical protein